MYSRRPMRPRRSLRSTPDCSDEMMICGELATDAGHGRRRRTRNMAIDWLAVERDDHTRQLPLRAIAEKHGCAHSTIANYASRHGWIRNAPRSVSDCSHFAHKSIGSMVRPTASLPARSEGPVRTRCRSSCCTGRERRHRGCRAPITRSRLPSLNGRPMISAAASRRAATAAARAQACRLVSRALRGRPLLPAARS
jgi:hypothetical protein